MQIGINNKIRIQSFGNVFPKQDYLSPKLVNYRLTEKAKENNWTTEDGGINQFDGSIETRYKDAQGKVMAAVIIKPGGKIDTVVEYVYKDNQKCEMHHTSQFGHSKTFYDFIPQEFKMMLPNANEDNIYNDINNFENSKILKIKTIGGQREIYLSSKTNDCEKENEGGTCNIHVTDPVQEPLFYQESLSENRIKITTLENQKLEEPCTICLTEFKPGDQVYFLPCIHHFHIACLREWIKKEKCCPICKFELKPHNEDEDEENEDNNYYDF
mgnify:CR=1 FL=1